MVKIWSQIKIRKIKMSIPHNRTSRKTTDSQLSYWTTLLKDSLIMTNTLDTPSMRQREGLKELNPIFSKKKKLDF